MRILNRARRYRRHWSPSRWGFRSCSDDRRRQATNGSERTLRTRVSLTRQQTPRTRRIARPTKSIRPTSSLETQSRVGVYAQQMVTLSKLTGLSVSFGPGNIARRRSCQIVTTHLHDPDGGSLDRTKRIIPFTLRIQRSLVDHIETRMKAQLTICLISSSALVP
jgi:hypothetical protein